MTIVQLLRCSFERQYADGYRTYWHPAYYARPLRSVIVLRVLALVYELDDQYNPFSVKDEVAAKANEYIAGIPGKDYEHTVSAAYDEAITTRTGLFDAYEYTATYHLIQGAEIPIHDEWVDQEDREGVDFL